MESPLLLLLLAGIFVFGLLSKALRRTPWTAPMVFTALGLVAGSSIFGGGDAAAIETHWVQILAEVTLVFVLFGDASKVELRRLRENLGIPARLLGVGLPLSIILGAALAFILLPNLGVFEALVLGAILAPTDAALGQAVVTLEAVPQTIRQSLNVESGLNDGIALPFVLIFAALAGAQGEGVDWAQWGIYWGKQVLLGPLVGVGVGYAGARALEWAAKRGSMGETYERLAGLSLAMASYVIALHLGGNGFISAFVGGLVMGNVAKHTAEPIHEFLEAEGQLLILLVFFLMGMVIAGGTLSRVDLPLVLYAVGSLTVVRMIPVALSLLGAGLKAPTSLFLGWFGPRGLASLIFGLLIMGEHGLAQGQRVFDGVCLTVLFSVFVHGFSAVPLAERYGEWSRAEA